MCKQKGKGKKNQIFWLQQNKLLFKAQSGPSAGTEMLNQVEYTDLCLKMDWLKHHFSWGIIHAWQYHFGSKIANSAAQNLIFSQSIFAYRASLLDWLKLAFAGHFSCQVPEQAEIPINFYIFFFFFANKQLITAWKILKMYECLV